jgi:antitoxin component of MazEF toxin-antitoxin module
MGELTKLNYANKTGCLRSAVPSFVVKQFNLKIGDRLEWELFSENNEIKVKLTPRKAQEV